MSVLPRATNKLEVNEQVTEATYSMDLIIGEP